MDRSLRLADETALQDLRTYLDRADRIDRASVRLVADSGVLAVYTAVLHPAGLLDETPTVLGLRTLQTDPEQHLDEVVPIRSLTERLRTQAERPDLVPGEPVEVVLPAGVNTVTWAGVAPPRGGWMATDQLGAAQLSEIARIGMAEVAEAVPADAGEPIVRRVRSEVWGRPIEGMEHIPAGAAFAAHYLGFLGDPLEEIPVYENGPWTRLSATRGHVLVKRRAWSLLP